MNEKYQIIDEFLSDESHAFDIYRTDEIYNSELKQIEEIISTEVSELISAICVRNECKLNASDIPIFSNFE